MQRGRSSRSSTTMHERSPAGLLRCWRRIDGQRSSVPEVKSSRDGKRGRRGGSHVNFTGSSAAATSDCRTSHARSATRLARTCPFAATRSSVSRGSRLGSGGSTRSRWVVKKPSWRSASGARREESLCISRARGSSTSFPRRGRRGDTSQRAAGPRDARRQASPQSVGRDDALSTERSYVTRTLPRGIARSSVEVARGDPYGLPRALAIVGGLGITAAGYAVGRVGSFRTALRRGRRAATPPPERLNDLGRDRSQDMRHREIGNAAENEHHERMEREHERRDQAGDQ